VLARLLDRQEILSCGFFVVATATEMKAVGGDYEDQQVIRLMNDGNQLEIADLYMTATCLLWQPHELLVMHHGFLFLNNRNQNED
jgi:hypothetical protein